MAQTMDIVPVPQAFLQAKADYAAANQGRFTRKRKGIYLSGSSADYHYRSETGFLKVLEYAQDMMRNDNVPGAMLDRAVHNIHQDGFSLDPQPGGPGEDPSLAAELSAAWEDWSTDPRQCDAQGQFTFNDLAEHALRSCKGVGDCFLLLGNEGALQLMEGYRCRTPMRTSSKPATSKEVIHGVLIDGRRRRKEYWFTRDDLNPWQGVSRVADMQRVPAFDSDGNPLVLHIADPKRVTQTRGVTAFAPVFTALGMFDDLAFANLVRAQIAACFLILRNREKSFPGGTRPKTGAQTTETMSDGSSRLLENVSPGAELIGLPGETLQAFSPQVPNSEFFEHAKFTLQLIGACVNLPLVAYLLDGSQTNFSGWRGALNQARIGWRRDQTWFRNRLHIQVYRWKLRQWIESQAPGSAWRAAARRLGDTFFLHRWSFPRWPYIQPKEDVLTDKERIKALLASPRRIAQELSQNFGEESRHIVEDNALRIELAYAKAAELEKAITAKIGRAVRLDPRQLLCLDPTNELEIEQPAANDADLVFKREIVKQFIADGTIGDAMFNRTDVKSLLQQVNVPIYITAEGREVEEPWLPVETSTGKLISGEPVEDESQDIVAGGVEGKVDLDKYAVGVRTGVITPQQTDESFFRQQLNLPGMGPATEVVWVTEGPRKPITIQSEKDAPALPAPGDEESK